MSDSPENCSADCLVSDKPASEPSSPKISNDSSRSLKSFHVCQGSLEDKRHFLQLWAKLYARSGASPWMVQEHLETLATRLNLTVTCSFLPGFLSLTCGEKHMQDEGGCGTGGVEEKLSFQYAIPYGLDLYLMQRLEALLTTITSTEISLLEASASLEALVTLPPSFSPATIVLAHGLLAGSICITFFDGSWLDALCSLLLGVVSGQLLRLASFGPFIYCLEFTACTLMAISALVLLSALPTGSGLHFWPIILSANVWLLPGFTIVFGLMDLFMKSFLSGLAWTFNGYLMALIMALSYGGVIWTWASVGLTLPPLATGQSPDYPLIVKYVALLPLCAAFALIYQARWRQWPAIFVSSLLSFAMSITISSYLRDEPEISSFLSAFLLGCLSRGLSALASRVGLETSQEVPMLISMLFIVPGARSVRAWFRLVPFVASIGHPMQHPVMMSTLLVAILAAFGLVLSRLLVRALSPVMTKLFLAFEKKPSPLSNRRPSLRV